MYIYDKDEDKTLIDHANLAPPTAGQDDPTNSTDLMRTFNLGGMAPEQVIEGLPQIEEWKARDTFSLP